MSDIPDDLTSVGRHHGGDPPEKTGQTVSSPEGPDPSASQAEPSPALFRLVRRADADQLQIRVHSPRAELSEIEDDAEELGQYRTAEALRDALADAGIDGWTGVFEDAEANRVLSDTVAPDHVWIGQPRYERITLFADPNAAADYAESRPRPDDSSS